jgi:hypothetical protein
MLVHLADRVFTSTFLYLILGYVVYSYRYVTNGIVAYGFLAAGAAYITQVWVLAINYERTLDRLGARAPTKRTWSPWNIGLLFEAIFYFAQHRNHEFWWKLFKQCGNSRWPYTVESITFGERIIFTADEEVRRAAQHSLPH